MNKKYLMLGFRSMVSLLILFYFFHLIDVDRTRVVDIFSRLSLLDITIALFILCATVVLQIWRWHVVTKSLGAGVEISSIINIFFGATFSGLILPSSMGGDAIRMLALTKLGLPAKQAMVSVGMDRIAGLLSLLWLVLLVHSGFYFYGIRAPIVISGLIVSIVAWCAIGAVFLCRRYENRFSNWVFIKVLFSLVNDFKTVNFTRNPGISTFLLSLAIQLLCSLCIYFIARSLHADITLWVTISLVPVVMLATAIPISIAGWGVREGAMVLAFGVLGVSAQDALVTSLLFGVLMTIVGFICGLMWLASFRWEMLFRWLSKASIHRH